MNAASRRGLLGGLAALAPAAALGAALPVNPDAELVAGCAGYIEAYDAYGLHGGTKLPDEPDPFEDRWHAALDRLVEMEATTMAGVLALARVAAHEAVQPDGREDFSTSFVGCWPEMVVRGVLRMAGGAA